jgi:hypothetical protein
MSINERINVRTNPNVSPAYVQAVADVRNAPSGSLVSTTQPRMNIYEYTTGPDSTTKVYAVGDVYMPDGSVLKEGTPEWTKYVEEKGYKMTVYEMYDPSTQTWKKGAISNEDAYLIQARRASEAMIDAADRGDPMAKVGEAGQSLLGFRFAQRAVDMATGNDTRENRIVSTTSAIHSEILARGDFRKSAELYQSSLGGTIGTSTIVGSGMGALYRVPILRLPIVAYGVKSTIDTLRNPETYTASGASATITSILAGTGGFKEGIRASSIAKYQPGRIASIEPMQYVSSKVSTALQPIKTRVMQRVYSLRGKPEVPISTYIKETPSGFVKSTPEATMAKFRETGGEFVHATGTPPRSGQIIPAKIAEGQRGSTEMYGLSGSPKGWGEENFLRTGKPTTLIRAPSSDLQVSILPKIKRSEVLTGKYNVAELPEAIRGDVVKARAYAAEHPETAYIVEKMYRSKLSEPEIKITPGVKYKISPTKEYFISKGKTVAVKDITFPGQSETINIQKLSTISKIGRDYFTYEPGKTVIYPLSYSSPTPISKYSSSPSSIASYQKPIQPSNNYSIPNKISYPNKYTPTPNRPNADRWIWNEPNYIRPSPPPTPYRYTPTPPPVPNKNSKISEYVRPSTVKPSTIKKPYEEPVQKKYLFTKTFFKPKKAYRERAFNISPFEIKVI